MFIFMTEQVTGTLYGGNSQLLCVRSLSPQIPFVGAMRFIRFFFLSLNTLFLFVNNYFFRRFVLLRLRSWLFYFMWIKYIFLSLDVDNLIYIQQKHYYIWNTFIIYISFFIVTTYRSLNRVLYLLKELRCELIKH